MQTVARNIRKDRIDNTKIIRFKDKPGVLISACQTIEKLQRDRVTLKVKILLCLEHIPKKDLMKCVVVSHIPYVFEACENVSTPYAIDVCNQELDKAYT